jgi:hypothetical protein
MALFLVLSLFGENAAGFAIEISSSTIDCCLTARPIKENCGKEYCNVI